MKDMIRYALRNKKTGKYILQFGNDYVTTEGSFSEDDLFTDNLLLAQWGETYEDLTFARCTKGILDTPEKLLAEIEDLYNFDEGEEDEENWNNMEVFEFKVDYAMRKQHEDALDKFRMSLAGFITFLHHTLVDSEGCRGFIGLLLANDYKSEIIIFNAYSLKEKCKYYAEAYDEDLKLKRNLNIRIVNYTYSESPDEVWDELSDDAEWFDHR